MAWFLQKKPSVAGRKKILEGILPPDDERLGPAPPPPPSKTPPGVTVFSVEKWAASGPPGATSVSARPPARASETRVVRLVPGARWERTAGDSAIAVLSGELASEAGSLFRGDVLCGARAVENTGDRTAILLVDEADEPASVRRRVGARDLAGSGFPGVTGIRRVFTSGRASGLRLGPPPGARWAIVGVRSLALESGRVSLVDGPETREVRAGEIAVVADPGATLYLVAGNDSAAGFAFASSEVVVALA